ncbi:MAG: DinB family protein [Actinobacteria bacterium]|nr:DinB family protein [Actinomycetota bacterium]
MEPSALLIELFDRIDGHVRDVLGDLEPDDLNWTPGDDANPIGWLVWHLARVIDLQIADVAHTEQVWVTGDWARGFGLDPDPGNSGYGHSAVQVAQVQPRDVKILGAYFTRVSESTRDFLETVTPDDLDRIVDERWDPPVTLGVRLVSIADDAIQHAGQARYVKGLLSRSGSGSIH